MSREEQKKDLVTEQPDTLVIDPPSDQEYHLIEPFSYLTSSTDSQKQPKLYNHTTTYAKTALLILNQEIHIDLISLWKQSDVVICADGGANRLYQYVNSLEKDTKDEVYAEKSLSYQKGLLSKYIPNYIVGDFDSLDDKIAQFYETHGTKLIPQSSQYLNDFMKSILCIQLHFIYKEQQQQQQQQQGEKNPVWPEIEKENGLSQLWEDDFHEHSTIPIKIYTVSAIGGRFDQTIQSINQLYILHQSSPNLKIFFFTNNEIIFLLYKGVNYVRYPSRSTFSRKGKPIIPPTCGLLPLSDRMVELTTHGLKYDVSNWGSKMTGNVSSSNAIVGETGFVVECSDDIVMNIEIDL